jgi:hypothetical protein
MGHGLGAEGSGATSQVLAVASMAHLGPADRDVLVLIWLAGPARVEREEQGRWEGAVGAAIVAGYACGADRGGLRRRARLSGHPDASHTLYILKGRSL